jgi:HSP20 family protein
MTKAQQKKEELQNEKKAQTVSTALPVRRQVTDFDPNRTSPFTLMRLLAEDMEKMMADFGLENQFRSPLFRNENFRPTYSWFDESPFSTETANFLNQWSPKVEVFQRENQFIVRADLPGVEKDAVNVEIDDNCLTIQGERKQESEEKSEGFYRSERAYGSFYREIPLPEGAKIENAKASFKNGVLEISVEAPPLPAGNGRRLEITEG